MTHLWATSTEQNIRTEAKAKGNSCQQSLIVQGKNKKRLYWTNDNLSNIQNNQ